MSFGVLHTFSDFDEELVYVVFEKFSCFFVEGVGIFVLFDVDEDQSDVFNDCKDEMLAAIVPIFIDLVSKVQGSTLLVDHRMEYLADEDHLRRFIGELIEGDFEFVSGVLVEAVADK